MNIINNIKKIDLILNKASKVFVIGHINSDLDAISSCLGMLEYVKNKEKYIILDDNILESGVFKIYNETKNDYNYIKSKDIKKVVDENSLIIFLDFNRKSLLKNPNIIGLFKYKIIIDHHEETSDIIESDLKIIDIFSSSASEMIASYLKNKNYNIPSNISTYLLSGIVLDTASFSLNINEDTFNISSYLIKEGADNIKVQKLFKKNIKQYIKNQKIIIGAKNINNTLITLGKKGIKYRREEIGRVADLLLQFENVSSSFVIAKLQDGSIGISGRTNDENVDMKEIMLSFGGGGNKNRAGANIKNETISNIYDKIKDIAKNL